MADDDGQIEQKRMPLGEHLEELRRRLIYALLGLAAAALGGLAGGRWLMLFIQQPYRRAMADLGRPGAGLVVLGVGEGLGAYMKLSLYFGLVLAAPWILYQLWAFVSAGLYRRERRIIYGTVPFTVVLFVGGAAFFQFLVAERLIRSLLELSRWLGLEPTITLANHVGFMLKMMLAFGLAFQTPLAVLVLAKVRLVGPAALRKYRRHAIIVILIFAALIGPGDPFTMLALAAPMYGLYELGVLLAHLMVFRAKPARRPPDAGPPN